MDHIPVSFDYKGKHYSGSLDEVAGAGAMVWHLMIGNYYRGRFTYMDKWIFFSNDKMFEDMADYFGEVVTLWYE